MSHREKEIQGSDSSRVKTSHSHLSAAYLVDENMHFYDSSRPIPRLNWTSNPFRVVEADCLGENVESTT